MSDVFFRTSLYGRFGHLMMVMVGLVPGLGFAVPFLMPGHSQEEPLVLVMCYLMSAGCLLFGLYSAWFVVAPSGRIRVNDHALLYRGLFGWINIPWIEIESARLNYMGKSPFVFLWLRRRGSSSVKVNVSGLTPTYEVLFGLICERAPHAVR